MDSLLQTATTDLNNQNLNFRILSFNIHKGGKFKEKAMQLIRDQIRILHPDFIFLQETFGDQFEFLAHEFWPHFCYGKNAIYEKGHHGNAILSKFPVVYHQNTNLSMGSFDQRGLLHAVVHPDTLGKPIHLLCVHLGLLGRHRVKQLEVIMQYIVDNIPSHEAMIIAGDFNDIFDHAKKPLIEVLGLHEAFLHHAGSYAKTFPAWRPMLKLDRVYVRGFHTHLAEALTHKDWKSLSDHIAIHVHIGSHPK